MEKILNKSKNHAEAARWDVLQQVRMTSEERQAAAKELKKRFYGHNVTPMRRKKK